MNQLLDEKLADADKKISEAEILLRNVKGAFALQNDKVMRQEQELVREVQLLLANDKMQWS